MSLKLSTQELAKRAAAEAELIGEFALTVSSAPAPASVPAQAVASDATQAAASAAREHDEELELALEDDFSHGDVGNAERFAKRYGHKFRYVSTLEKWYMFDGAKWSLTLKNEDKQAVIDTIQQIKHEVALAKLSLDKNSDMYEQELKRIRALHAHYVASHNHSKIVNALSVATTIPDLVCTHDELDADPMLFNAQNGTVDLRTGLLREHVKNDMLTKASDVEIAATSDCPTWKKFLLDIMCGDEAMVDWMQKVIGYAMTGRTDEQVFFLMYGSGANGKSTFLHIINKIFGSYSVNSSFETFMERRDESSGPRGDVARLKGARFVSSTEGPEGKAFNEPFIKSLTGGDLITARFLYGQDFEFKPCLKLFLATNHKPIIKATDNALWRRLRLIPFNAVFSGANRDNTLTEKLERELPAIFRWCVEGCQRWQAEGLGMPVAVERASGEYRDEMDTIGSFLNDVCSIKDTTETKQSTSAKELYASYATWCEENGIRHPIQRKRFKFALESKGYKVATRNVGDVWLGLVLKGKEDFKFN